MGDHRVSLTGTCYSDREENAVINQRMDALVWLRKQLETGDNDLLCEMVRSFAEGLMGAEADVVCGAPYGETSPVGVVAGCARFRPVSVDRRSYASCASCIPREQPVANRGFFEGWMVDGSGAR